MGVWEASVDVVFYKCNLWQISVSARVQVSLTA